MKGALVVVVLACVVALSYSVSPPDYPTRSRTPTGYPTRSRSQTDYPTRSRSSDIGIGGAPVDIGGTGGLPADIGGDIGFPVDIGGLPAVIGGNSGNIGGFPGDIGRHSGSIGGIGGTSGDTGGFFGDIGGIGGEIVFPGDIGRVQGGIDGGLVGTVGRPGGLSEAKTNDMTVRQIARYAASEIGFEYSFLRVNRAQTQVVSGVMYHLDINVVKRRARGQNKSFNCDVKVHSQPWMSFRELTEFHCRSA